MQIFITQFYPSFSIKKQKASGDIIAHLRLFTVKMDFYLVLSDLIDDLAILVVNIGANWKNSEAHSECGCLSTLHGDG